MISDEEFLADLLPGFWSIGASNFPMWLRGDRTSPALEYERTGTEPLRFIDRVTYVSREGEPKLVQGIDTHGPNGFTWRGKGILKIFASRWQVIGAGADGSFAVIRFARTRVTPAGVDIISREGVDSMRLRTTIAAAPAEFGLSPEEFASLTWLEIS